MVGGLTQGDIHFSGGGGLFYLSTVVMTITVVVVSLLAIRGVVCRGRGRVRKLRRKVFFSVARSDGRGLLTGRRMGDMKLSYGVGAIGRGSGRLSLVCCSSSVLDLVPTFSKGCPRGTDRVTIASTFFTDRGGSPRVGTVIRLGLSNALGGCAVINVCRSGASATCPIFISLRGYQRLHKGGLLGKCI